LSHHLTARHCGRAAAAHDRAAAELASRTLHDRPIKL